MSEELCCLASKRSNVSLNGRSYTIQSANYYEFSILIELALSRFCTCEMLQRTGHGPVGSDADISGLLCHGG